MATTIITSILLLLAITLHGTSGCSCFEPPTFCNASFGIKGIVTDINTTSNQGDWPASSWSIEDIIYSVQVLEVYQSSENYIQVNTIIDIQTPGEEGLCGTFLEKGVAYLISGGEIAGGSYEISHCQSVVLQYRGPQYLSIVGIPCSDSPTTTPTPITTIPTSPTTIISSPTTIPTSLTTITTIPTSPTTIISSPTTIPTSLTTITTTTIKTMSPTSGCLCDEEPAFCSSDFAIKGTVTNIRGNRTLNEDLIYRVQVQGVYRDSSEGIRVDDIIDIQTPRDPCGIAPLEIGLSYLISGGEYTDNYTGYTRSYSMDVCTSVVLQYNDVGDNLSTRLDIIPCSASMTTITSHVVIACALLHFIFQW